MLACGLRVRGSIAMGSRRPNLFAAIVAGTAMALAVSTQASEGSAPALAATSEARPPLLPVASFAQRDLIANPLMSPDGKRVATLITHNGQKRVAVLDLANKNR